MTLSLTQRDQQVIWHPYTQHKNMETPVGVISGKGALLFDEQGRSYIDAISSWWVNIHGHAHPYIAEKIYRQALQLEHVIFTGFTHEPAVQLAERLLALLPGNFSRIFYSDNGSTAVEVALKMAIQYWKNQPEPGSLERNRILAFRDAYHGDTFGAMSVSGRSVFTKAFDGFLFEVVFIDTPSAGNIDALKAWLHEQGETIACFIYEPLLQAAGGMRMYDAVSMEELLRVARQQGILCIADEVMTGFGRTGTLFASENMAEQPDMICLSKGLTGGTMALGVTAATSRIFNRFLSDDKSRTFFHGHSFTANPLACAAALASMDLLQQSGCMESIARIAKSHLRFGQSITDHRVVKNCRALGTVLAFEIESGTDGYLNTTGINVTRAAMQAGIYLRPLGNTLYIMPPYCITDAELYQVYQFAERFLDAFGQY